jgi:site-specific recombinase XerC
MVKYSYLLEDSDVKRWYDNLAVGSQITADVYLRGLGRYCELNNSTPKEILQRAETKEFRDNFMDFVRKLESQGKAGSYINRYKKVIASWLNYSGIQIKLKVNIKGVSDTPTLANERVPTKMELAKILRKSSPRGRVSIVMMAYSGLRPESLGDYNGKDGLRLGDFKEAKITPNGIEFEKTPSLVTVRSNLSKGRFQYFTFIPQETATYLKEYLETRVKTGERLVPETPLLQFDARGNKKNPFLRTALVTRDIREAMRSSGFSWRPYVLRAYCDTAFDIAESKGLISHPWRMFFMGHKGDIEARYSTNKARLPPLMVEEMRQAFKKASDLMQTTNSDLTSEDQWKKTMKEQFLLVAGFKKEEVDKMNIDEMTDEELQNRVRQKLLGFMSVNGSRQKVIPIAQVKSYLSQGFEFVAPLPGGEAIVKMPF